MNNLQSAMFNYMDWFVDPSVRSLDPATRDAYSELIWRAVAAWDDGFITGPRDKRANLAQATAIALTTKDRMETLLDLGLIEVIQGAVYVQRGLDLLRDQDGRRSHGRKGGKGNKKNRPNNNEPESTQDNPSQSESTQVDPGERGQDRTGQDRKRQDTLSLSSEPKGHPAPARTRPADPRESDTDFWGPKIEAVYQVIHGEQPQPDSRKAIAQALRTHRATDLVLAVEGARRNKWALEKTSRRTLAGILSAKRIDGHIQDARGFYQWTNGAGEDWADGMMRNHGGMR